LIVCSATCQISLIPNKQGQFCTDTVGLQAIGKALKELEYTRVELGQYDQLTANLSKELQLATQAQAHTDSLLSEAQQTAAHYQAQAKKHKSQRWWFGGIGFLLGIIAITAL